MLLKAPEKKKYPSLCPTTLSGDLSSLGFVGPLLEASSLDSFQADLGESGKGIYSQSYYHE